MIEYPIMDASNQKVKSVELNEAIFGREVRGDLLVMAVNYQRAKSQQGSASTLGRAQVRGGGRKPYRQKGTGNARQGTISAVHYRGGGIVFGPTPRDFAIKMPKKVRKLALQTALSAKREEGDWSVVGGFGLSQIKTKAMRKALENIGANESAMIVIPEADMLVERSSRNLPRISVIRAEGVNVYDILTHDKLVITEAALGKLEERLG